MQLSMSKEKLSVKQKVLSVKQTKLSVKQELLSVNLRKLSVKATMLSVNQIKLGATRLGVKSLCSLFWEDRSKILSPFSKIDIIT